MIKVLYPGIYCSVQDLGRFGYAKMGIPSAGAMDQLSSQLGNVLLTNPINDAVIEITFGMARLEFTSDAFFCLTGADFSQKLNGVPIQTQVVYQASKGSILSFGQRKFGARTYVAVQGGVISEMVLNSRSFMNGITSKMRLQKGDLLAIGKSKSLDPKVSAILIDEHYFFNSELECFPGPEYDQLQKDQKKRLMNSFTISEDNNRVGYRLNEIIENNLDPIITSAVLPGTVQLTPSGKLIVLMRDGQVTGGYPRVLQLSDLAISILSQKIMGESFRFKIKKPYRL